MAFEDLKYAVVRRAIAPERAAAACQAAIADARQGVFGPEPKYGAIGRYAHPFGEELLGELLPVVEGAVGKRLHPCYSFLRVYARGAELARHLDRPSCEYSTTMTLGFDSDRHWPIWVEHAGEPRAVPLEVGDMMVYKGAQVVHWREPFDGRWWMQVFMHYVDADGDYAAFRFDGRDRIGPFDPKRDARRNLPPPNPRATDPCPCLSGREYGRCHGAAAGAHPDA